MFKELLNSDDLCVKVAIYTVIFILVLLVVKYFLNNYYEKFTSEPNYIPPAGPEGNAVITESPQSYIVKSMAEFDEIKDNVSKFTMDLTTLRNLLFELFNINTAGFDNNIISHINNLKNIDQKDTQKRFYNNLRGLINKVNLETNNTYNELKYLLNNIVNGLNEIKAPMGTNAINFICGKKGNRKNICNIVSLKNKNLANVILPQNTPNNNSNDSDNIIIDSGTSNSEFCFPESFCYNTLVNNVCDTFANTKSNEIKNKLQEIGNNKSAIMQELIDNPELENKYSGVLNYLKNKFKENIANKNNFNLDETEYLTIKQRFGNDEKLSKIEDYFTSLLEVGKMIPRKGDTDFRTYQNDLAKCGGLPKLKL